MESIERILQTAFPNENPSAVAVCDLALFDGMLSPVRVLGLTFYDSSGRVLVTAGPPVPAPGPPSVVSLNVTSATGQAGTLVLFSTNDPAQTLDAERMKVLRLAANVVFTAVLETQKSAELQARLKMVQRETQVLKEEHRRVVAMNLAEREARLNEHRAYEARLEVEVAHRTRELCERNKELETARNEIALHMESLRFQQRECELAMRKAEEANASKTSFLANMSHEIRTPLTAIMGFAELLLEQNEGISQQEAIEHLQTIRRNGEHLLGILNDILDIAKIESGKMKFEQMHCNPRAMLDDIVRSFRVKAEAKRVRLHATCVEPAPASILTDPARLRQILMNLVGNAVKFTNSGEIHIRYGLSDPALGPPKLQFEVIDTGIGIPADKLECIFEPFVQADSSTTRKFGGTGLGLSISRRLARLMGGDLRAQSEPNVGSTFTLTIELGDLEQHVEPHKTFTLHPEETVESLRDKLRHLSWKVLLAEDSPDNQRLISFHLKHAGAAVQVVPNGAEAVDAALASLENGHAFDIVLMDMQMPVMDGYQATTTLRQKGYFGPIIALTAHAMKGDRIKCLEAGCDDYATKPVRREELFQQLARYLLR